MVTPPQEIAPPVVATGKPLMKTVLEPEAMVRGWGGCLGLEWGVSWSLTRATGLPSISTLGEPLIGFYPATADIPKKRHTVPKECSCPDAENIAQSSNAKPLL